MSNDAPRAVVTGSSSGIGQAIAHALLAQGWHVTGFDIAAPCIEHERFAAVGVDLCDGAAAEAAADGELMWRLHVESLVRIANALIPAMAARGRGRVVLVGSRVALGKAARSQYAATKAALVALARSWAAEVVAFGVTVNVVSPAATQTAMTDDPARKGEAPVLPPLGRLIRPDEIAALVLFLLSPMAAAITGQDIQICGGASLPR